MKLRLALTALLLICAASFGASTVAPAQAAGITMTSQAAKNAFPDGIEFTVTATSDRKITAARLRTFLAPRDFQNTLRGECTGDTTASCKATYGGSIGTNVAYIVPFSEIRWYWELTDEAGQTLTTPEQKVTYEDTRFRWKSQSAGNLTLWFYSGSDNDAREMLQAARQAIDDGSKLVGVTLDFPVKLVDYATVRDLQLATTLGRRGGNSNSVLLGQVGTADTALSTRQVFGNQADPLDTARHEVMHIVTNYATRGNPQTDSWVDEGISMYAQKVVENDYKRAVDLMIRNNKLYPIRSMVGESIRTNDPSGFYGEAYTIIKYMVDTYGQDKFRDFIKALNTNDTDGAIKAAFGVGTNDFENQWRKSLNLPPIEAQTGTTTNTGPVILTVEPLGNPSSSGGTRATPAAGAGNGSSSASSGSDGGSSALPIVGVVIAAVVVLGGAGTMLIRRKKA